MNSSTCLCVTAIVIISGWACSRWLKQSRNLPLPPGPRPLPLLGNVHQLPLEHQQRTFALWAQKYGDIVYARLFRTPAIVISSLHVAQQLMETNSAKYSDRPRFVLLNELMAMQNDMVLMPYGQRWRRHRKWVQDVMQNKSSLIDQNFHRKEILTLLSGLIDAPDLFMLHIKRWAAALMMEVAYGHQVTSLHDERVSLIDEAVKATSDAGGAASTLVDFFPILKNIPSWMPGAGFKRKAYKVRAIRSEMQKLPYQEVKTALFSETAKPSLIASLLDEYMSRGELDEETEDDIKGIGTVMYSAGTDTTVTILSTFFLAMVIHPEVYRKAQSEVDQIVGRDRLPDYGDRDSLPYLECIMKELYRWNCPVPLGVPHRLVEDDAYRGYYLPRGSIIIPNIWAMTQNPEWYPEPEKFKPERFLAMNDTTMRAHDPRAMVFGFGRRICPGKQFADSSLWLAIANIVATLDISKATDKDGKEITPIPTYASGAVSHVKEFPCSIRPRSPKVVDWIAAISME